MHNDLTVFSGDLPIERKSSTQQPITGLLLELVPTLFSLLSTLDGSTQGHAVVW